MPLLQPDAAASLASVFPRAHLRVVDPPAGAPDAPEAPRGERALLDAWREAHWSLRMRMREAATASGAGDLEALYDAARRADNQLTEFYQARADVLTRRLRDALGAAEGNQGARQERSAPQPTSLVDHDEHALLRHFRALGVEDRASLLRLASRLSVSGALRDGR